MPKPALLAGRPGQPLMRVVSAREEPPAPDDAALVAELRAGGAGSPGTALGSLRPRRAPDPAAHARSVGGRRGRAAGRLSAAIPRLELAARADRAQELLDRHRPSRRDERAPAPARAALAVAVGRRGASRTTEHRRSTERRAAPGALRPVPAARPARHPAPPGLRAPLRRGARARRARTGARLLARHGQTPCRRRRATRLSACRARPASFTVRGGSLVMRSDDALARDEGAAALGRLGRVLEGSLDRKQDQLGKERFLVAIAARRRSRYGWAIAAAAAVIAIGVALVLGPWWKPPALEYSVVGSLVTQGEWLGVPPDRGAAALRFSEGTELELGPGSQGRVADLTPEGAHFVLGKGRLHARVVHRPKARWVVAAGPYTIEVTGTAFDVGWSDAGERLEVKLHDGSVIVRGPSLRDGIRLGAGQRLVASARQGGAELSSLFAPEAAVEAPAPAPSAAPPGTTGATPEPALSVPRPPSWSEQVAEGKFKAVLEAARARGVEQTLSQGSLADLAALSDAARYAGERGLARRGLLAQRTRFASSAQARAAAFILGRMADDGGSPGEALGWYERYLAETPKGAFAAEAFGRKIVALVRQGRSDAARDAAENYLKRFPRGAHAAYAKELLQNR